MDYSLLIKCKRIIHDSDPSVAMQRMTELLLKDKDVKSVSFIPAGEGVSLYPEYNYDAEKNVCNASIPIKNADAYIAILKICYQVVVPCRRDYDAEDLEWTCLGFNRAPIKEVVRDGTPWGTVEVRQAENTHVNYYWPDKAVLYTTKVLQYRRPEEIDQFIESQLGTPGKEKLIDENYELNYPLFKLRIKISDSEGLSHEQDSDGIWWVNCPNSYDLTRRNAYLYIRDYFKTVITSAAEEYFPKRVAYLESRMNTGKRIAKISCKFTHSSVVGENRYVPVERGSTQDDGSRSLLFDPILMAYPAKYTDMVIIHELCHNIYFDHTKKFRELEEKWCLAITGYGPHYYDDFFATHRFCLFEQDPFKSYNTGK